MAIQNIAQLEQLFHDFEVQVKIIEDLMFHFFLRARMSREIWQEINKIYEKEKAVFQKEKAKDDFEDV